MEEKLKIIGLYDKEAKIFLSLLKLGTTGAKEIAEFTGIKRPTCYDILSHLVTKGYISEQINGGKKEFKAVDIDVLFNRAKSDFKEFEKDIPYLRGLYGSSEKEIPRVQFYRGIEGVKSVLEDTFTSKDEILTLLNFEEVGQLLEVYVRLKYRKKREAKKIKLRGLFIANELGFYSVYRSIAKYKEVRFLPGKELALKIEMHIYNDKIGYIFPKNDELYGVIIQDEDLVETQKSIFNVLWNYSEKFNITIPSEFDVQRVEKELLEQINK